MCAVAGASQSHRVRKTNPISCTQTDCILAPLCDVLTCVRVCVRVYNHKAGDLAHQTEPLTPHLFTAPAFCLCLSVPLTIKTQEAGIMST